MKQTRNWSRPSRWLLALSLGVGLGASLQPALAAAPSPAELAAGHLALPVVKPVLSCEQLAQADLRGAADAPVQITESSVISTPKGPFCKVLGTIAPSIGFEVDLPQQGWTQRYLQGGCGGMCGMTQVGISNAGSCGPALNGEFVVAGNDMGHKGTMGGDDEASFGADPQKRIDFAYRGNHQTARVAKALIKAFYGQGPRFSYFMGCSDGGREALIEAQRFPDDFDGISAGAPATLWQINNSFHHAWTVRANQRADGSNILLGRRMQILHKAVLAHCPTLSGVDDGLLQDPRACSVDPSWAQCTADAKDSSQCLTAEEVSVVRKLYQGPTDAQGRRFIIGGPEAGAEAQWMLPNSAQEKGMGAGIAARALQYLILPEVDAAASDLSRFAFDTASFARVSQLAPLYNGANTNLAPFQQRGGKLILWHGWSDTSVTPAVSLAYYQGVQKQLGTAATDRFMRLFLLPGVGHCGGGDGYSQIELLAPLMAWTELQRAPAALLTGKPAQQAMGPMAGPPPGGEGGGGMGGPEGAGGPPPGAPGGTGPSAPGGANAPRLHAPVMASNPVARADAKPLATRPVYPYPAIARYTGQGDPKDAANYQPGQTSVARPLQFNSWAEQLIGPDNQKNYGVVNGKLVSD